MIHIGAWRWGDKYPQIYMDRLRASVARNFAGEYTFHEWAPEPEDKMLTMLPGCFARLRAFDPDWQMRHGIKPLDRIVNLDLDLIVTGPLAPIFGRKDNFAILQGVNASNPNPYNGSVWTLMAGHRPDVWQNFTLEKAKRISYFEFPDDQAWFHHMIPDAGAITPQSDGVYAFGKPGWPGGHHLPAGARIVCFPGFRDPKDVAWTDWAQKHWRT